MLIVQFQRLKCLGFFILPSLAVLRCSLRCCCVLLEAPGHGKWFCNFLSVLGTMQVKPIHHAVLLTELAMLCHACFGFIQESSAGEGSQCYCGFYIGLVLVCCSSRCYVITGNISLD